MAHHAQVPTALYDRAYASFMQRGMPQLALDTLVELERAYKESLGAAAVVTEVPDIAAAAPAPKQYVTRFMVMNGCVSGSECSV